MAETYCSAKFKCGEDLDEALASALECCGNADRAEEAATSAKQSEEAAAESAKQAEQAALNGIPDGSLEKVKFTPSVQSQLVRKNLLDNAYFGNPVDQRGGYLVPPWVDCFVIGQEGVALTTTSYMKVTDGYTDGQEYVSFYVDGVRYNCGKGYAVRGYTGTGYTIDRWKVADSQEKLATLIKADSVTLDYSGASNGQAWFTQESDMKFPVGETLTLSVLVQNLTGTAYLMLGSASNYIALAEGMNTIQFVATSDIMFSRIVLIGGAVVEIRAAKLELGTEQTLAHQDENGNWVLNEIPNYAEELAKCQRYFVELNPNNIQYFTAANGCGWSGGTEVDFVIPVPVTMRANPSMTSESSFNVVDATTGKFYQFTSKTCIAGAGVVKCVGYISESVQGRPYVLMCGNTARKMQLSADL